MTPIKFLKTALTDYKVGALTVSSRFVAQRILGELKPDYHHIVEYGAGEGFITKAILEKLPENGRVIAIELNDNFVKELQKIKDPRLTVIKGNIVEYSHKLKELGLPRVDAVVSGIPFTFLKPAERKAVAKATHDALREGGTFIVYQHSRLMMRHLKTYFSKVRVSYEPRNFLPYFVMAARK